MVSDSQKRKAIREFLIPDTLKDDIAYCQRSLRDCVKVHQYFAQRYNSLSAIQQGQVKQYLLELEDEMRAIGKEQSGLVQDLARRLKHFQRKTATEKHIELGDDLANGYVAWVLSSHAEIQCSAAYVPHAVSERLNESQLYQKYPLLSCAAAEAATAAQPEQERKPDTVR
ncbi:AGAP011171-PA, partial [Anopheles gambiae str. PEST]